jgi:hypothetical protein
MTRQTRPEEADPSRDDLRRKADPSRDDLRDQKN